MSSLAGLRSHRGEPFAWSIVVMVLLVLAGCSSGRVGPQPVFPVLIDDNPAWSPDGKQIAFHRCVSSSLGPPGLYVLELGTGACRLLMPGDAIWPENPRFSATGDSIVCDVIGYLWIIDVESGYFDRLPLSTNVAIEPEWGPGGTILYHRWGGVGAGFWCFDLKSGTDTALTVDGTPILGQRPDWNDRLGELVFSDGASIRSMTVDPPQLRTLLDLGTGHQIERAQWVGGTDSLLFMDISTRYTEWLFDTGTRRMQTMPLELFSGAPSPAADSIVVIGTDPTDSERRRQVLLVRPLDNRIGAPRRQVTFWRPATDG